jgi:hypothetical protein
VSAEEGELLKNKIRTGFIRAALVLAAIGCAAWLPAFCLQASVPDMASEPHHRLLMENEAVRVFAVTVPAHQQAYVAHARNFVTVTLQDSDIVLWREGQSPVQHFQVPLGEVRFFLGDVARGIRNDSNSEYRNVTVEFKDPQVTNYGYQRTTGKNDYGPAMLELPVDPHGQFVNSLDLHNAVANDVQLLPKDVLPPHEPQRPALIIAVSPVDLLLSSGSIHLEPGEVRWLVSRSFDLVNAGKVPARFVVIGFR